jgi:hypothetical protein
MGHRSLAQLPAQQDVVLPTAGQEVDQTDLQIFHLAAQVIHLGQLVGQGVVIRAKHHLGLPYGRRLAAGFPLQALGVQAHTRPFQLHLLRTHGRTQLQNLNEDPLQARNQAVHLPHGEVASGH